MRIKEILFIGLSLFIFSGCNSDDDTKTEVVENNPDRFVLNEKGLYPETVVYSSTQKKSYIGSYYKGKIVTLDASGTLTDFVIDNTLVAVVGMRVNEAKNQLIVCNSDSNLSLKSSGSTLGQLAQIIIYDLKTAEKMETIDLSTVYAGGHFLNDVTFDTVGNLYVTDSFSPVIYKIDTNFNASVLIEDELFKGFPGGFGLNGIEYHPDNFLIVGMSNGNLFKVSVDGSNEISSLNIDQKLKSSDGILLQDKDTLLVVSNNLPAFSGVTFDESITRLTSDDNWLSAETKEIITTLEGTFPTTLLEINNDVYVNFGEFSNMIGQNFEFNDFKLQKIVFSKN